jgi:small subunit ribosomal protein S17
MTEAKTSLKRTLVGKVVSDKRAKTVTVLVERRVKHALYGKIVIKSSKYHAHDEKGEYHTGDVIGNGPQCGPFSFFTGATP